MTDPQTAADAAERCPTCAATAPYWRPDDRECEICLAVTEVPSTLDELASDAEDGYGADVIGEHVKHLRQKHALLVEHVGTLLADRKRMAAELEQVRGEREAETIAVRQLLGCADQIAAAAYQARTRIEAREAAAEQQRCPDCSHGASAHRATTGCIRCPCNHGRTAVPTRPADGKRTPEQWCAEYRIDIADPDGWRNTGDPAWDEPITLPDFLRRAARSTTRGLTLDVWNRLSREAHEAADAERSDAEGAEKGPESHAEATGRDARPPA